MPGRDRFEASALAVLHSTALAIAGVTIPLHAISAGLGVPVVGALVATSATGQIVTRLGMSWLLRVVPDRTLLIVSALCAGVSCGTLALSQHIAVFLIALLIQGAARALFWTASQTHAIRLSSSAVGGVASVGVPAGVGGLVGALLAGGLISVTSTTATMGVAATVAIFGVAPGLLLKRLPPFVRSKSHDLRSRPAWRRDGVHYACWTNATAGAWRGIIDSYVPLLLVFAGQSAFVIGLLVAVTNLAVLVSSTVAAPLYRSFPRALLPIALAFSGGGIAAISGLAPVAPAAGIALAVSGLGVGIVQTVSPAIASEAVDPNDRGSALTSTGTFRAVAQLATPAAMGGMLLVAPLSVAFAVAGVVVALPALARRRHR